MLHHGSAIIAVLVTFALSATSTVADNTECKYCEEYIKSKLYGNEIFRKILKVSSLKGFEQKIVLPDNVLRALDSDFVKICKDICNFVKTQSDRDKAPEGETFAKSQVKDENAIRRKRDASDGILTYFAPPFGDGDSTGYEVNDQDAGTGDDYNDRSYVDYVEYDAEPVSEPTLLSLKDTRRGSYAYATSNAHPGMYSHQESVMSQEESLRRMLGMLQEFTGRTLERLRGIIREEISQQMQRSQSCRMPQARAPLGYTLGLQQNIFFPYAPPPPFNPEPPQRMETTRSTEVWQSNRSEGTTEASSRTTTSTTVPTTESAGTTTEIITTDSTDEVTTEIATVAPRNCDEKILDTRQFLPALLEAMKKNGNS